MTQTDKTKRGASQPYNGHPNWNQWNVHLWISSDYDTYKYCLSLVQSFGVKRSVEILHAEIGQTLTPDGARYSKAALRHALLCIRD